MDLLSSLRKEGSRGGVNFSWSDVTTSQHRENYLGHSVMAPIGRWQKGKDLSWYAKADEKNAVDGESAEEKRARERKEEIRLVKEAEEDALARALGLPVKERGLTGSNAISVGEVNRAVKEAGVGEDDEIDTAKGFGEFVGKVQGVEGEELQEPERGGLVRRDSTREGRPRSRSRERKPRRHHRNRSRGAETRRHRSRSRERHRHRHRDDKEIRRPRSRSVDRERRRHRSRSPDRHRGREGRPRRSRSPESREHRRHRDRDYESRR